MIMSSCAPRAAVVGTGIIGLLSAYALLERGYHITLIDQQLVGQGASWAGGGILTPLYPWKYPHAVNALARYGQAGYRLLNQRLYPMTAIDCEIETSGLLILDADQQHAALQYGVEARDAEQRAIALDRSQLRQLYGDVNHTYSEGVYFPQIAHVRNPRLLKSLIHYLLHHPAVDMLTHTRVQQFKQQAGQVTALITDTAHCIEVDQVIFATGAWSGLLSDELQLGALCTIAVKPIHGQMVVFKTPPGWLSTICMDYTMYAIPRRDGHIVCGSSTQDIGFSQTVDLTVQDHIITAAHRMLPRLADFPIVHAWSGLRPGSNQGIPIIDRLPAFENVWLNTGHYRNGLVMAPGSVQLLMQLMHQELPWVDPTPYRFHGQHQSA